MAGDLWRGARAGAAAGRGTRGRVASGRATPAASGPLAGEGGEGGESKGWAAGSWRGTGRAWPSQPAAAGRWAEGRDGANLGHQKPDVIETQIPAEGRTGWRGWEGQGAARPGREALRVGKKPAGPAQPCLKPASLICPYK